MKNTKVTLAPLEAEDREQFILDNQESFKYGAVEEFGLRDDHFEEDGEIISRATIEQTQNSRTIKTAVITQIFWIYYINACIFIRKFHLTTLTNLIICIAVNRIDIITDILIKSPCNFAICYRTNPFTLLQFEEILNFIIPKLFIL